MCSLSSQEHLYPDVFQSLWLAMQPLMGVSASGALPRHRALEMPTGCSIASRIPLAAFQTRLPSSAARRRTRRMPKVTTTSVPRDRFARAFRHASRGVFRARQRDVSGGACAATRAPLWVIVRPPDGAAVRIVFGQWNAVRYLLTLAVDGWHSRCGVPRRPRALVVLCQSFQNLAAAAIVGPTYYGAAAASAPC